MKNHIKSYWVWILLFSTTHFYADWNTSCAMYRDSFGPLQTAYTMGDLVRYTVTPGINQYNGFVAAPTGAQDIFNLGKNTYNLYNTLGYLYAGWVTLNYQDTASGVQGNMGEVKARWINSYRQKDPSPDDDNDYADTNDSARVFDNNPLCKTTILFPCTPNNSVGQPSAYNFFPVLGDTDDSFNQTGHEKNKYISSAGSSCGWCPNTEDGHFVLTMDPFIKNGKKVVTLNSRQNDSQAYICPTGQFFGTRIAHILGAVVNDVPWVDSTGSSLAGGTGDATSITANLMGNKTLPMLAIMNGNSGSYSISYPGGPWIGNNVPKGMFQQSTAHFGSIGTFINNLTVPTSGWNLGQIYIRKHFLPTVNRLASVCYYSMSNNTKSYNLIQINDDSVTPYDQGVVIAIQNNTGDSLTVNQVTSTTATATATTTNSATATNSGTSTNSGIATNIAALQSGINNHFLHTASLMPIFTGGASTDPVPGNMISIVDEAAQEKLSNTAYTGYKAGLFIQVLNGAQLTSLSTAFNQLLGTYQQGGSYIYNQSPSLNPSFAGKYLVITNFDPTVSSGSLSNLGYKDGAVVLSYRMQIIDIEKFINQPYFLTIQINKENLGYGLMSTPQKPVVQINPGNSNVAVLYPSVVSCKLCKWQSIAMGKEGQGNYSKIPLILAPDIAWNSGTAGFQAYYYIWLMSYISALTEFSYNGQSFCTDWGVHSNVFGLLSDKSQAVDLQNIKSGYSSQRCRVVVDAQGYLRSGETFNLGYSNFLMGCDTLDVGSGFNQDIPILNFATSGTDENGDSILVANSTASKFINLSVTFGVPNPVGKINPTSWDPVDNPNATSWDQAYGLPFNNIMMFSLPTQAVLDGVNIAASQVKMGNYQLVVTSTKDFSDADNNTVPAGSVLAAPKVFVDSGLYNISQDQKMQFNFLYVNNNGSAAISYWNSPQTAPLVQLGQTSNFALKYKNTGGPTYDNVLQILSSPITLTGAAGAGSAAAKTAKTAATTTGAAKTAAEATNGSAQKTLGNGSDSHGAEKSAKAKNPVNTKSK